MKIKVKLWWDLDSVLWHKKYGIRALRLAEDRRQTSHIGQEIILGIHSWGLKLKLCFPYIKDDERALMGCTGCEHIGSKPESLPVIATSKTFN